MDKEYIDYLKRVGILEKFRKSIYNDELIRLIFISNILVNYALDNYREDIVKNENDFIKKLPKNWLNYGFFDTLECFLYIKKLVLEFKNTFKLSSEVKVIKSCSNFNTNIYEVKEFKECNIYAIEKDSQLQNILRSKSINVIDSDFLHYNRLEQVDLIVMNPPFDNGEKHLLKAIDIMLDGQIVCILNANTIKNPYSNTRKELVSKLKKLDADIEYISGAFSDIDSQRKTDVEIALIYIDIRQDVETDLFDNLKDEDECEFDTLKDSYEVATQNDIKNLVIKYNKTKEVINNQIVEFYKNYKYSKNYIDIIIYGANNDEDYKSCIYQDKQNSKSLTQIMKSKINALNTTIKKDFWYKSLELKEVRARLTQKYKQQLQKMLESYSQMEFSESNVRQFVVNVIEEYPKMIEGAIVDMFDYMCRYSLKDFRWIDYKENIHYYNAWKTNDAYKVNKKVILPFYDLLDFNDKLRVTYKLKECINEFEIVLNYFSGKIEKPTSGDILEYQVDKLGNTKKIDTPYFLVTLYKKGTVHFEFKDLDLLRRFNIAVGKAKNWLPMDYANKSYEELDEETKKIVDSFETKKEYKTSIDLLATITNPITKLLPNNQADNSEIKNEIKPSNNEAYDKEIKEQFKTGSLF